VSRRDLFESVRASPALIAGVPGDAVDLDALVAHLAARRFHGGIAVGVSQTDGVLWLVGGTPAEAWFFEASGTEAVLPAAAGVELLRALAARGGALSVVAGVPEGAVAVGDQPPASNSVDDQRPASNGVDGLGRPVAAPAREPPAARAAGTAVSAEPLPRPWPEILTGFAQRLARHRGDRLAARFLGSLASALAPHGGRVEDGRVTAPPLPETTWRAVVERACAAIVPVVGRGFVDRTIAAAEQDLARARTAGDVR
jgi:hypothetical protein